MDHSLPVVSDDGDLSWSDSYSMVSDDSHSAVIPNSPPWLDSLSGGSVSMPTSSTMGVSHTGPLSPVSTGVDVQGELSDHRTCHSASSSTSNMTYSASSSSRMESWGGEDVDVDDIAEVGDGGDGSNEFEWQHDGEDGLMVPKLEPVDDDDFRLDDVKEAPLTPIVSAIPTQTQPKAKRPRGRPRKHPLTATVATSKVTKGRSKTGCLTCRKRKKKCDEAKPRCMNCEKNAVVCEGYPEKQIWKSGREKAEEERLGLHGCPSITMRPIFHGLETVEDHIFWKHYNEHLSTVLTVEGEHKNAFRNMIVPIAVKHEGLMHSILSLASKHLDYDTPYGANILHTNPDTSIEALQHRSNFHHEKAVEKLYTGIAKEVDRTSFEYKDVLSAQYGQMLCLLLESKAEGNPRGEHRVHLQAYQAMIKHSPPTDPAFLAFITEFFQYHIFADELIRLPDGLGPQLTSEHWTPASTTHPSRLLGVTDGLFNFLSQITTIRNAIRTNMLALADPVVDYDSLYIAAEIDLGIRHWTPRWPSGDSRNRVGLLYKLVMSIYLLQTIYPPSSAAATASLSSSITASAPTMILAGAPVDEHTSPVYTPPQSTSSSCASSPRIVVTSVAGQTEGRDHVLLKPTPRKNNGIESLAVPCHDSMPTRADSPAPIRHPSQHDPRITATVNESLEILETFKPSDPSQTLLLVPCLVIGAASFVPAQRDRVRTVVKTIRGYTGMRNTDHVARVLEKLWDLMDAGEWATVWDWQNVANNMGVDCIIT